MDPLMYIYICTVCIITPVALYASWCDRNKTQNGPYDTTLEVILISIFWSVLPVINVIALFEMMGSVVDYHKKKFIVKRLAFHFGTDGMKQHYEFLKEVNEKQIKILHCYTTYYEYSSSHKPEYIHYIIKYKSNDARRKNTE